jgi:hypothetical protein
MKEGTSPDYSLIVLAKEEKGCGGSVLAACRLIVLVFVQHFATETSVAVSRPEPKTGVSGGFTRFYNVLARNTSQDNHDSGVNQFGLTFLGSGTVIVSGIILEVELR